MCNLIKNNNLWIHRINSILYVHFVFYLFILIKNSLLFLHFLKNACLLEIMLISSSDLIANRFNRYLSSYIDLRIEIII